MQVSLHLPVVSVAENKSNASGCCPKIPAMHLHCTWIGLCHKRNGTDPPRESAMSWSKIVLTAVFLCEMDEGKDLKKSSNGVSFSKFHQMRAKIKGNAEFWDPLTVKTLETGFCGSLFSRRRRIGRSSRVPCSVECGILSLSISCVTRDRRADASFACRFYGVGTPTVAAMFLL